MSKTVGLILALEDKCSPQLNKIADKMGITEKEAKKVRTEINKVAKSLKNDLATAGKAIAIGFGAVTATATVLLNKSVEAGDRIDKMSQKMQMSRKTFQELDYVFSQNGSNVEVMKVGMTKLTKAIEGARTGAKGNVATFKALGISIRDTSGRMKSTETVMFQALAKLQKMPEGARKSALALSLFGKSANELAPLLNGNAKGVDELRKRFNDLSMGMSDAQVDAAVKFKDTMDSIQRSFAGLGNQIGGDLLPVIQQVADKLIENLPKIKETVTPVLLGVCNAVKFLINHFDGLITISSVVVGTLGAFKVISGVIKTITIMKTEIQAVTVAQGIWNVVMRANPVGLIAVAIGGLIGLLTYLELKFKIVTKAVNKFKEVAKNIGSQFAEQNERVKASKGGTVEVPPQKTDNKPVNKYASGTLYAHGGKAVINEKGAELVELPEGSKVMTANATKQIMNGGSYTINLNIAGNVIGNNEFIRQVSNALGRQLVTAMAC